MKPIHPVLIPPPPPEQRVRRDAAFAKPGERESRYTLPRALSSGSPVGYRTRVPMSRDEAAEALAMLSLTRPTAFAPGEAPSEAALFEEVSLGILSARQSTNYRGQRQITLGPADSAEAARILRGLSHREAEVLDGATHTHVVLCRPYRTPFTLLLTFIGHRRYRSLLTVPMRAFDKWKNGTDDIPTIGFLTDLHVGILADAMERAAIIASNGERRAQVHMGPFCGAGQEANAAALEPLYALCGVSARDRRAGWRLGLVAQVGAAAPGEAVSLRPTTARKLGANLLAFRSERIQPGVNHEERAPAPYQTRQDMDVPEELAQMCARAAYNAFAHWTGTDREAGKGLLLHERVDVLSPAGKERLRSLRHHLGEISDRVIATLPRWADLLSAGMVSRSAARGRKAFALAGQRIYVVGLSRPELAEAGLDWHLAIRGLGAACARSALVAELMGVTELPEGCDMLGGICLMAGPVNQNDVGKSFYGYRDLLADALPGREPTSMLVWTLKAKTVADPIGNEEQLLDPKRKGMLVDLRPAPHEVCAVRVAGAVKALRSEGGRTSQERAFADMGNFVTDPSGTEIPGNRGERWTGPTKVW